MDFKVAYFYVRQGWIVIAPIFGFANTLLLIYISLNVENYQIPMWIFGPIMAIVMLVGLTFAGKLFREKQQSTDIDLSYWKSTEALITTIPLYDALLDLLKKEGLDKSESYDIMIKRRDLMVKHVLENGKRI